MHVERSEGDANQEKTTEGDIKTATEQLEQLMNRAINWNWDRALEIWRELHPNVSRAYLYTYTANDSNCRVF